MKLLSVALGLLQLGVAGLIVATSQNSIAEPVTVIQVDPASVQRPISPLLYGTNHRYPDNGFGMWDASRAASVPAFDAVYDDIGCKAIRYPGGTMANLYEWKKAIGPVSGRAVTKVIGDQGAASRPERISFGLDECLRWAEKHGTEVVYMYNMANGSAQDAADLVEYLNAPLGSNPNGGTAWAEVRAKNGHPEPYRLRYFEIGNEMFLRNQRFWLNEAGPNIRYISVNDYWVTEADDAVKAYAFGSTDKQGVKHDGFTRYYLMVINRDGASAVTANLKLDRVAARQASIWSLSGADFTAANTVSDPHKVRIEVSLKSLTGASSTYAFPPHSLTSLQFDK